MDGRRRRNLAGATFFLLGVAALVFWLLFPSPASALRSIQAWIDGFGFWGPAVFVLLYIVAVVVLVPGSLLALVAGLAYGMWGLPLALAAATTGASLSFLIARHLARSQVQAMTRRHLLWRAVERAVSECGWRIVGLIRLSPVLPFKLQNYFFGITHIPFRHYVPATFLGILPGTAVNVSLATAGQAMTLGGLWHPLKLALFVLGSAVTVAVCWTINRRVQTMLMRSGQALAKLVNTNFEFSSVLKYPSRPHRPVTTLCGS
jgi:uncharacterized membrane protein YdjX (TVP38/TMEM64 family)